MPKITPKHVCESSTLLKVPSIIPRMVSNDSPSGRCFASSAIVYWYVPYEPYYAFDKLPDTQWISAENDAIGSYIGYDFGKPTIVKRINIQLPLTWAYIYTTGICKEFIFQGSNDGVVWMDIETFTFNKKELGYRQSFKLKSSATFNMFRIYITKFFPIEGLYYGAKRAAFANIAFFTKSEYTQEDLVPHNNVYYAWNDGGVQYEDFFSKMYLWNDTCDGLIWEKRHPTDEFVMTFGDSNAWLIFPREGYASAWSFINRSDKTRGLTEDLSRGGVSKDFVIRANRDYFGVSKNGREWVMTDLSKEFKDVVGDMRYRNLLVNPRNNTGIIRFFYCGRIFGFSVDSSGHVSVKEIHLPSNASIVVEIGGFIFFQYQNAQPGDPIYKLTPNGNIEASSLVVPQPTTGWRETTYYIMNKKWYAMSKTKIGNPPAWEIFMAESTDGFSSHHTYSFDNFPHYGHINWGYQVPYYFDNSYRMIVPREDKYDVWEYGSSFGNAARVHYDCNITKWIPLRGWRSNYNFRNKVDSNGGQIVDARCADPYWTINNQNLVVYFKDGKIVEPYNAMVRQYGFAPYTNLGANTVISGDIFNSGNFESFMFQATVYRGKQLTIDKNNVTWKLGYIDG